MINQKKVIEGLLEAIAVLAVHVPDRYLGYSAVACRDAIELLEAQEPVVPYKNYQYLSDFWCECGWHLGKAGSVKYCPECGRRIKWNA